MKILRELWLWYLERCRLAQEEDDYWAYRDGYPVGRYRDEANRRS